ncbi:MAG TPA: DinB family protein [Steroidobacteraceae bacterium]|nr:DinB family protein [Steroidobacteraceae bacterium]
MPEQSPNVFTYPRNEPGTQGHLDLVEALRVMPQQLAEALRGVTSAEAVRRGAPGRWCIKELVGHLRDAAEVYHQRLYMMATQTDPVLEPYDQDAFAAEHHYMDRDIDAMLRELASFRAVTVELLTTLVNWNWARTGQHLETGRLSIRQIVEHMVEHETGHIGEIRRLRAGAP